MATAMNVTVGLVAGSLRSSAAQVGGGASLVVGGRRIHFPIGISSNPRTNNAGTTTKVRMPTYGFCRTPTSSSAMRNRNSRALTASRHARPRNPVAQSARQNGCGVRPLIVAAGKEKSGQKSQPCSSTSGGQARSPRANPESGPVACEHEPSARGTGPASGAGLRIRARAIPEPAPGLSRRQISPHTSQR